MSLEAQCAELRGAEAELAARLERHRKAHKDAGDCERTHCFARPDTIYC